MSRSPVRCELLKTSARLTGPGVLAAIEATGVKRMRDITRKSWLVPITRVDDVLAYIEHVQRRSVDVVDTVDPNQSRVATDIARDLFGEVG